MDAWGIKNYAGQIEVVEKLSSIGEISVRVLGIEALQDVGGLFYDEKNKILFKTCVGGVERLSVLRAQYCFPNESIYLYIGCILKISRFDVLLIVENWY